MVETLLSPSNVLIYGRVLRDLKIDFVAPPSEFVQDDIRPDPETCDPAMVQPPPPPPPRLGRNNFLQEQLADKDATLARIYGFSFEGHYYDLSKPAIFLVHGPGKDPEAFRPGTELPEERYSRASADADRTGVAGQAGSFSEDIVVWSYDKGDFTIRLDTESGSFEEILLGGELAGDHLSSSYSGAEARIRTSGAEARIRTSGAEARSRNRGGRSD